MHDLLTQAASNDVIVPLALIATQNINKDVRIRRLTPYLVNKMVRFRDTPGTHLAVTQHEVWNSGDHDDAPDSAEMAIRLANESGLIY